MGEFISDFSIIIIGLFLLLGVSAMGVLPIIRRWGEQTMKIHRPTEREKIDANADRLRRFDASGWRCVRCGKSPPEHGDYLQDKPMGRCPWCGKPVGDIGMMNRLYRGYSVHMTATRPTNCRWSQNDTELDNRARYQEERMAAAKIEERSP